MNEFREAFRRVVQSGHFHFSVPVEVQISEERDVLIIPKQAELGFEVRLVCEDYGIYPIAEGWHSGCWDVTVWKPSELEVTLKEFISSILDDAVMEVNYSNGRPYRWTLHHNFQGQRIADTTGLLFYNWFGARTTTRFCNAPVKPN